MRNMSFSKTTPQALARTKTVTRRKGWSFLKPGDHFRAVKKAMGLRKGEEVEVLALCECVSNTPEPLSFIRVIPRRFRDGTTAEVKSETAAEGFPEMTADQFVEFFCREIGGNPDQIVNRIQFRYIDREVRR